MNFKSVTLKIKGSYRDFIVGSIIFVLLLINVSSIVHFNIYQAIAGLGVLTLVICFHSLGNIISITKALLVSLGLLLFSFVVQITNLQRWYILLLVVAIAGIIRFRQNAESLKFGLIYHSLAYYLVLLTGFHIILHFKTYILQFMTYGYDNALHFSIFKAYQQTSWFPFVSPDKWSSDFSLFRAYPSGQSAFFSFLSGIFTGDLNDPLAEVCVYFLLLILTFLGIVYLTKHLIKSKSRGKETLVAWMSSIIIAGAFAGVLLVNGFPPYLFGLLVVLMWTSTLEANRIDRGQTYLLGLTVISLLLVSPLLILCIIIPGALIFTREIHGYWGSCQYRLIWLQIFYTGTLGIIAIKINSMTNSKFGWRQVLAGGGIQPPHVFEAATILVFFIIVLFMQRKRFFGSGIAMVAFSTLVSFTLLAILTISYTGSIQYYATKQFYLCLVTMTIVVMSFLFEAKRSTLWKYLGCAIVIGIFLSSFLYSSVFTTGFMGTLPNAIKADLNVRNWQRNVVDANYLIGMKKEIDSYQHKDCLIFRVDAYDSDLNSRWANAIANSNSTSEACFSVYWNSNQLTDQQLLARMKSSQIDFVLIIGKSQANKFTRKLPANVSLLLE